MRNPMIEDAYDAALDEEAAMRDASAMNVDAYEATQIASRAERAAEDAATDAFEVAEIADDDMDAQSAAHDTAQAAVQDHVANARAVETFKHGGHSTESAAVYDAAYNAAYDTAAPLSEDQRMADKIATKAADRAMGRHLEGENDENDGAMFPGPKPQLMDGIGNLFKGKKKEQEQEMAMDSGSSKPDKPSPVKSFFFGNGKPRPSTRPPRGMPRPPGR